MAGSLEGNKLVAAILTAGIIGTAAGNFSRILYAPEELTESHYKIQGATAETAPAGGGGDQAAAEAVTPIAPLLQKASVEDGKKIATKCQSCHSLEKGGPNKIGPDLWGVVDRPVGKHEGFTYSSAVAAKGGNWTYEELNHFLHAPRDYIQGTKMTFAGLPKESDRADVIAYLRTLSDNPEPMPPAASQEGSQQPPAAGEAPAEKGNKPSNQKQPTPGKQPAEPGAPPSTPAQRAPS